MPENLQVHSSKTATVSLLFSQLGQLWKFHLCMSYDVYCHPNHLSL